MIRVKTCPYHSVAGLADPMFTGSLQVPVRVTSDVRVIYTLVSGIGSTGFSFLVLLLLYTDEYEKNLGEKVTLRIE